MNKRHIDNRASGIFSQATLSSDQAVRLVSAILILASLTLLFRMASIW